MASLDGFDPKRLIPHLMVEPEEEEQGQYRLKSAAVLVPILFFNGEWCLLFTRRSNRLRKHSGQVAFPGGSSDETDLNPAATALREAHEEIALPDSHVKILSTTNMLFKLAKLYNVPIYETGVGFKYVAPKFTETDAIIGGEESGGYAFRGNVPERDGILAGLYFLDLMVKTGLKPSQLLKKVYSLVGPHFYDRIDTRFLGDSMEKQERIRKANPESIGGLRVIDLDTTDGFKFNLEDGGWLLIRFSGTEPIIRVYTETTQEDKVQAILRDGLKIAGIE